MKILRNITLALATGALLAGAAQLATPSTAVAGGDRCEERCKAHAQDEYRRCLRHGGDPDRCAHAARATYRRCVRGHCQD